MKKVFWLMVSLLLINIDQSVAANNFPNADGRKISVWEETRNEIKNGNTAKDGQMAFIFATNDKNPEIVKPVIADDADKAKDKGSGDGKTEDSSNFRLLGYLLLSAVFIAAWKIVMPFIAALKLTRQMMNRQCRTVPDYKVSLKLKWKTAWRIWKSAWITVKRKNN